MKTALTFIVLLYFVFSLPYQEQVALANSLVIDIQDRSDVNEWTCKVCDPSNKPIHSHIIQSKVVDTSCVLSVYPSFAVLAFRYTSNLLNTWKDILYPLQIKVEGNCGDCKVQKSYNNMWEKLKQDVLRDLKEIKTQTNLDSLIITGVGLGGGLSALSYIDIAFQNIFSRMKLITFGAPRVGNKYWAAYFDLITLGYTKRYFVYGDPIVFMPRCFTLLCNYRHTGIKIVCYQETRTCQQQIEISDDDDDEVHVIKHLKKHIIQDQFEDQLQSIMNHINGYSKIYNFTLIVS